MFSVFYMTRIQIDLALLQEPWFYRSWIRGLARAGTVFVSAPAADDTPKAYILAKNTINLLLLREHYCRDLVAARLEGH